MEPHNFNRDFAISDVWNLKTKAGRESRDAFAQENSDKIIINLEQRAQAGLMADAILNHPFASAMLADTVNEQSFYWPHEIDGAEYLLKVRPDVLHYLSLSVT